MPLTASVRDWYWSRWDAMFQESLAPDARTICKFIEQEEEDELERADVRSLWIDFCLCKGLRVNFEMDASGNVYELEAMWLLASGASPPEHEGPRECEDEDEEGPSPHHAPFEYQEYLESSADDCASEESAGETTEDGETGEAPLGEDEDTRPAVLIDGGGDSDEDDSNASDDEVRHVSRSSSGPMRGRAPLDDWARRGR
ncbi:unnamed protein product [Parajaminaea phylloscopi]